MLNPSLSSFTRRRDSTRQLLENFLEKGEEEEKAEGKLGRRSEKEDEDRRQGREEVLK